MRRLVWRPRTLAILAGVALAVAVLLLSAAALGPGGAPVITAGSDACEYCHMQISDPRYGAAAVTARGTIERFDSIECLASFTSSTGESLLELWVSDFFAPGSLIRVEQARFLEASTRHSPMGRGLLAVSSDQGMRRAIRQFGGREVPWIDVLAESRGHATLHAAAAGAHVSTHRAPRVAAGDSVVVVEAGGPVTLAAAATLVARHGRVIVRPGIHPITETVRIAQPLEIEGEQGAVLDGDGKRTLLLILADSVSVRGLTFRGVEPNQLEDRAAIRIDGARACRITGNRVERGFFGIYVSDVSGCAIADNILLASGNGEATSGNGVHLWSSRGVAIARNYVSGYRDGIYFEFVHDADVRDNVSERNLRYGLHFMYSDDARYERNQFRANGSGVAVMYTKRVTMRANRFEQNRGGASYGLLLKEISDSRLDSNVFIGNTVALLADGAARLQAGGNLFHDNGWAVRLGANTENARFHANRFERNTFDVATNGRVHSTTFSGNFWDQYRGYDLDQDGVGDVPYFPVRLFSLLVEREEPSLILLRSGFVHLLDAAERALPSLTPAVLVDSTPAMRRSS